MLVFDQEVEFNLGVGLGFKYYYCVFWYFGILVF